MPHPAGNCSRGVIFLCASTTHSFPGKRFPVQPEAHQDINRQPADDIKAGPVFQAPAERFMSDSLV